MVNGLLHIMDLAVERQGFEDTDVYKDLNTLKEKLIDEVFADAPWGVD